jgi:hypothetical protein
MSNHTKKRTRNRSRSRSKNRNIYRNRNKHIRFRKHKTYKITRGGNPLSVENTFNIMKKEALIGLLEEILTFPHKLPTSDKTSINVTNSNELYDKLKNTKEWEDYSYRSNAINNIVTANNLLTTKTTKEQGSSNRLAGENCKKSQKSCVKSKLDQRMVARFTHIPTTKQADEFIEQLNKEGLSRYTN